MTAGRNPNRLRLPKRPAVDEGAWRRTWSVAHVVEASVGQPSGPSWARTLHTLRGHPNVEASFSARPVRLLPPCWRQAIPQKYPESANSYLLTGLNSHTPQGRHQPDCRRFVSWETGYNRDETQAALADKQSREQQAGVAPRRFRQRQLAKEVHLALAGDSRSCSAKYWAK